MPKTLLPDPPPTHTLGVEMGFYADISWESRCKFEINVGAHFCKIFLVFEVNPESKGCLEKVKTTVKLGNKERFDKEQIGIKEPFSVTNLPFTS